MKDLKIVKNRKIFLSFSLILLVAAFYSLFTWGLNFGIDFKGGSLLEVSFNNYEPQPLISEINEILTDLELGSLTIQPTEDKSFIIRFKETNEEMRQLVLGKLNALALSQEGASLTELRFDLIGPSIGQELKSKSFNASLLVLLMVIAYISFAFRKSSRPVSSWKYGLVAILALAHDVVIVLGAFAVLGNFYGIEVNTPFIAAILTVLGYSVSDTIVVFDRIRENLPKSNENFKNTVNNSINQTIGRSLSTSFSTILALLAILFFGGSSIRDFALALLLGVTVGTYSSVFIASPLIVSWHNLSKKNVQ